MNAHNIYAHIKENIVINTIISESLYQAERIGRMVHGRNTITIDVTQYPVSQGYTYKDGIFYDYDNREIKKVPTAEEDAQNALVKANAVYNQMNIVEPNEDCTIEEYRDYKLKLISKICQEQIHKGVEIETSQGLEQFSCKEEDQINIRALVDKIKDCMIAVPYHANGKPCRLFTAEEILTLNKAGEGLKVYHTTLYSYLKVWINRVETKEEIQMIQYDSVLPDDLKQQFEIIIHSLS